MARTLITWAVRWLVATVTLVVCFAQAPAQFQQFPSLPKTPGVGPPPTGMARASVLTGEVSVLKDSYPWVLSAGDLVRPRQIIVTGEDGFAVFELSDGSSFQVFANSRVTFRDNPGDWGDLLDLWIGRVKVFIQKLGNQPNNNRVFTPTAVISVRGTVFDVLIEDEQETTLVSVDEGTVDVRHRLIGESRSKLVEAGEYLRVFKNEPLAKQAVDRNALIERMLRASAEAAYTVLVRTQRSPIPGGGAGGAGGGVGGGVPLPGDTGGGQAPTPPAPAPSPEGGTTVPTTTAPPIPPPPPPGT